MPTRDGSPNLRQAAQKLAASPRTLQRQLKHYGPDFKNFVNDTRRQFALDSTGMMHGSFGLMAMPALRSGKWG